MCQGSAYHDLYRDRQRRLNACRRKKRWHGVPIPECEYCGAACVTDEDEKMLRRIAHTGY